MLHDYIGKLLAYQNLTEEEAREAMEIIMTGQATAGPDRRLPDRAAHEGRNGRRDRRLGPRHARPGQRGDASSGNGALLDTAGTGGDGKHTFNISTAAAFVIAGAGRQVAKHGNRAASSRSGSADVLAALGVNLDLTPEQVGRCIDEIGIGFLFAPKFHPAMKHAVGPRKELGQRTIFNILGPLTNPAGATHQIIGVYDPALTHVLAEVLGSLGSEAALVLHGFGGLDELTTGGPNRVSHLRDGKVTTFDLDAVRPLPAFPALLGRRSARRRPGAERRASCATSCAGQRPRPAPRRGAAQRRRCAGGRVLRPLGADPCGVLRDTVAQAAESLDSGAALREAGWR